MASPKPSWIRYGAYCPSALPTGDVAHCGEREQCKQAGTNKRQGSAKERHYEDVDKKFGGNQRSAARNTAPVVRIALAHRVSHTTARLAHRPP